MITVERSRIIPANVARIWDVLADFDRLAEWADNADHTCWLDDPHDEGEMIGRARRVQAGRVVLVETITVWEPPARLAYDLGGLPPVVKSAVNEWRLCAEPSDESRAVVTLATHVDCGPRPPQRLLARIVGRRLAGASHVMLDGLTAHLEAQAFGRPAGSVTIDPAPCDSSRRGDER